MITQPALPGKKREADCVVKMTDYHFVTGGTYDNLADGADETHLAI